MWLLDRFAKRLVMTAMGRQEDVFTKQLILLTDHCHTQGPPKAGAELVMTDHRERDEVSPWLRATATVTSPMPENTARA